MRDMQSIHRMFPVSFDESEKRAKPTTMACTPSMLCLWCCIRIHCLRSFDVHICGMDFHNTLNQHIQYTVSVLIPIFSPSLHLTRTLKIGIANEHKISRNNYGVMLIFSFPFHFVWVFKENFVKTYLGTSIYTWINSVLFVFMSVKNVQYILCAFQAPMQN